MAGIDTNEDLIYNSEPLASDYVKQAAYNSQLKTAQASGLDNGIGCAILGVMYDGGKGVRQSNTKALEYYGKACDLKSQLGCENYAKRKDR